MVIYAAIVFYLKDQLSQEVAQLKEKRNELEIRKQELESDIAKIKLEIESYPKVKAVSVSPLVRLGNDLIKLSTELSSYEGKIKEITSESIEKLKVQLASAIPQKSVEIEQIADFKNFEIKQEKTVDEFGLGPSKNSTYNNDLKYSGELRQQFIDYTDKLETLATDGSELLTSSINVFNDINSKLESSWNDKWNLVSQLGIIRNSLDEMQREIQELKLVKPIPSKIDSEINNSKSIISLYDLMTKEFEDLGTEYASIDKVKEIVRGSNMINFAFESDYLSLVQKFGKEFSYNRLISSHDELTKELFDSELSGKSNIFIYMELYTKRRVGFYLSIPYPKRALLPKSYKDLNSFIVYFNKNEYYLANQETSTHFRTDNDFLLIAGNTQQNDGLWISAPNKAINNGAVSLNIGYNPTQFLLPKSTLFSNLVSDRILTFEVFELKF